MKKYVAILLFLASLCSLAFASHPITLQYSLKGISGKIKANVVNQIKAEKKQLGKITSYNQIRQFSKQAPKNIQKAIEPYGYFQSKVHYSIRRQDHTYLVTFNVQLGAPVRITKSQVNLEGPGKYDKKLQLLLKETQKKLAVGRILKTAVYDEYKQKFYDQAESQGYLKGFFSAHVIKINTKTRQASIQLTFNTGPRYYFGSVIFSKNPMATDFLRRFLPFQSGQPFSSKKLLDLQNDLSGTVYFDQVNVVPDLKHAKNQKVPVLVKLKPAKAQQYSFGVGYGTDTGVRASYGWQWRRVTPSGDYLQTLLQVSQKNNNAFQASYIIPGKHPTTDHYALNAGIFTNEPGTGDDRYTTSQFGASYVRLLNGWTRTLSLQYQNENFRSEGVLGNANTIVPGVSFEKIVANNRINTINGYRIYFDFKGGFVLNNSKANFFQNEFQGKFIRSFHKQDTRLIFTTDLGYTVVRDFDAMPLSQRFFTGGAKTVRGYDFQELGPGRYLIFGGIEWQQRICGKFYGAVFYNAGNAFQNPPINLAQSVGVGILYRSPIGPIEITIAHPFNRPATISSRNYRIQFSMGPDL